MLCPQLLFILLLLLPAASVGRRFRNDRHLVYVGGYTGNQPSDSKGLYAFSFDSAFSKLNSLGLVAETPNPSYVLIHPSQKYLIAVNEGDDGTVVSFSIDSTTSGHLTRINQQPSRGGAPCYLSINKDGTHVFVANYGTGSVATLPISSTNGSLSPATGFDQHTGKSVNPDRQEGPHAHSIRLDPTEQFALSADLGSDQLYSYRFTTADGQLQRTSVTRAATLGDGPRHLIFSQNGKYVYVMNELTSSITVFAYGEGTSPSTPLQTISTLPVGFTGTNTAAEILLHPSQQFLYSSNRGNNSIALFNVNQATGLLSLVEVVDSQGQTPRNFNILPDGRHLLVANQDSANLAVFKVDQGTGRLSPVPGNKVSVPGKPTSIKFVAQ